MHQTVCEMSTNNREPELKEDLYIYALRHQTWVVSANYFSVKSKLNVVCAWCQRNSSRTFEWWQIHYHDVPLIFLQTSTNRYCPIFIQDDQIPMSRNIYVQGGRSYLTISLSCDAPGYRLWVWTLSQIWIADSQHGGRSKTWLYIARQFAGESQDIVTP